MHYPNKVGQSVAELLTIQQMFRPAFYGGGGRRGGDFVAPISRGWVDKTFHKEGRGAGM